MVLVQYLDWLKQIIEKSQWLCKCLIEVAFVHLTTCLHSLATFNVLFALAFALTVPG